MAHSSYQRTTLHWVRRDLPIRQYACESDHQFLEGEKSTETKQLRQSVAEGCEQQIWSFFEGGGQVVIYDANNGTRAARKALAEKFDKAGIHVIFLGKYITAQQTCAPVRLQECLIRKCL